MSAELFTELSVVFDTNPLLENPLLENPLLEKVEQKNEQKDEQNKKSFLKDFGSTFLKGGKGRFGVINLKAISTPITEAEQDFIFEVDCSGSMSDACSDGRKKMQHINHTLKNMILYIKENPSIKVFVTIHAFDSQIHKIVERTLVDETTYDKISTAIDTIVPRAATNIEMALNDAKNYAQILTEQYPSTKKTHIFMTDGQATEGNYVHSFLSSLVDNSIENVFIGFGMDHDSSLLNSISEGKKSNYYFIDKLENAGLVYGEILHGILYKFLENVEITISKGLIYNYKTNTWNQTLEIGNIASECSKFYHVVSDTTTCEVKITGTNIQNGESITTLAHTQEEPADLKKYIYRQITQQILFRVNQYYKINKRDYQLKNETFKILKNDLREFFNELKKYIEDNQLTDDVLLKNLCDDVYICHRTFGKISGDMFCTSRIHSQGLHRAYTATHVPEDDYPERGSLRRQNAIGGNLQYEDEEDYEEVDKLEHQISGCTQTPYRNESVFNVMRSLSSGANGDDLEEEHTAQY
jgi:uncharacterized protein YegL